MRGQHVRLACLVGTGSAAPGLHNSQAGRGDGGGGVFCGEASTWLVSEDGVWGRQDGGVRVLQ